MGISKFIFLHLLTQFCYLVSFTVSQQPKFLSWFCSNTNGNFTSNSNYETNLQNFFSSITSTPTQLNNGFYNISLGNNPDDILNGIALCRGDITADSCTDCLTDSTSKLPQLCPTQKEAIIWYDMCMVRYSNQSIFGVYEYSPYLQMTNPNGVADLNQFNMVLGNLLRNLQNRAQLGDSQLKFATGDANVSSFVTLYALAQCTPDLSEVNCFNCIGDYINLLANNSNGKQGARVVGPSCNVRYEIYLFYTLNATASTTPISSNTTSSNSTTSGSGKGSSIHTSKILIIVAIASVFSIANVLAIVFCLLFRRKLRWNKFEVVSPSVHEAEDTETRSVVASLQFKFDIIRVATQNFTNKIGSGGFGTVYKGKLANGQEIAVKRLSVNSRQGDAEFKNEVLIVAKLQHRNLVKLLGFCLEGEEMLLVYEFVPNTSLDHYLFDPIKGANLHWGSRYKIIIGIARGLLYLHEDSRLRIIHRDLKASNVLLDEDMNPKIADFGIARLFAFDQTQGDTSRIVGTYGYMAPEYALHGLFSVKSDVYSLGILILEIITGRRNFCQDNGFYSQDLVKSAWRNWREGTTLNIVDPTLSSAPRMELMRCIQVGLLCIQDSVEERPTMSSVLLMLSSHSDSLPTPSHPAFITTSTRLVRSTEVGRRTKDTSKEQPSVN